MKKILTQSESILFIKKSILVFLLFVMLPTVMGAQMVSVVNSLADDDKAYPFDDPDTPQDESQDGKCMDELGRCTLRAALDEAGILGIGASVTFSVSGQISLIDEISTFNIPDNSIVDGGDNISINGAAAFGIFGVGQNTTLKGFKLHNAIVGIVVGGDHNTIGGTSPNDRNTIYNTAQMGISLNGAENKIIGNYIGLDPAGQINGGQFGIYATGVNNTIGGTTPEERNIISGNINGIATYTVDGSTFIIGNYIGTDPTGTESRSNNVGINILGPHTTVGGITEQERNIISGNNESAVLIGIEAFDNAIFGNYIGLDATGEAIIPNRDGIILGPGSFLTFVHDNKIVGNSQFGIFINGLPGLGSLDHTITGNEILNNGGPGIGLQGFAQNNTIGSDPDEDEDPNVIQFNSNGGVVMVSFNGTPDHNTVRKNNFKDNSVAGIIIDLGAQDNIEVPVIDSYTDLGLGVATIAGTHPRPGSTIDIYIADEGPDGVYQGTEWIGSGIVSGNNEYIINADACDCDYIVATATDPAGNTSEFSNGFEAMMTGVDEVIGNAIVNVFPNPSTGDVNIQFSLQNGSDVGISIYDTHGRKVSVLHDGYLQAGEHSIIWNAGDNQSGIYYFKLITSDKVDTFGKIVIIR